MTRDAAEELAEQLRRHGLATPARILLEAHRPMSPILADGATFLRPFLSALGPGARRAGALLAEPGGLERLVARLAPDRDEA
ncbi:MAG: hypothetical protein ACRDGJ_05095 [Candidatus Limnocylindria bacterium]